jgi:hypothetical protein
MNFIYCYTPKKVEKQDNTATVGTCCHVNVAAMAGRVTFKEVFREVNSRGVALKRKVPGLSGMEFWVKGNGYESLYEVILVVA